MKFPSLFSFVLTSRTISRTLQLRCISNQVPIAAQAISHESLPSGLCAVYKPKGWSSNDVVQKVRSVVESHWRVDKRRPKIKVGHGGTLDPLAEGVLVLGIGEGTKLMTQYLSGSKGYFATALLGQEMDTLDSTGIVKETKDCSHITLDTLNEALAPFRGDIMQIPPMFSALKRDGNKLYDLARAGVEVEREPRPVTVHKLTLGGQGDVYNADNSAAALLPQFTLDIESGGGFYVRSLISDLARSVGGVAHMTALVRTKQGGFVVADCIGVDQWTYGNICDHIVRCSWKADIDCATLTPAYRSPR